MRTHRWLTRRSVLAAGFGLVAAPASSAARAEEPPKMSPAEAQYQPMPKGMFSCSTCSFFVKPTACKVVAGA
ncbi:MAG TPA: hypothetical protein VM782_21440, partial [Stellaceae bacterium]|nr:hypothetical protein [Stellaceae bacterium]